MQLLGFYCQKQGEQFPATAKRHASDPIPEDVAGHSLFPPRQVVPFHSAKSAFSELLPTALHQLQFFGGILFPPFGFAAVEPPRFHVSLLFSWWRVAPFLAWCSHQTLVAP